jgi:Cu2+-exporting ATPase
MVFSLSLYGVYLDPLAKEHGAAQDALTGVFRVGAMALALPVLLLIGAPLLDAVLATRRWLSADALVVASAAAAFAYSAWNTLCGTGEVYFETAAVVLALFGLGRWLETRARERAAEALRRVLPERERAVLVVEDGRERAVDPRAVRRGQLVRALPGDVLAVDGLVERGRAFVDGSALSGEAEAKRLGAGDAALAGARLLDGALLIRAERVAGERLRDGIERTLAEALASRPPHVRLADRLASWLLPAALCVAALTATWTWGTRGGEAALLAALAVILIACPCALGIATPLAYWTAVERVWRRGVLVRNGAVLERLARVDTVLFDKTGTLTNGSLELIDVRPLEPGTLSPAEVLRAAASLERAGAHPIARAVCAAARARADAHADIGLLFEPDDVHALPGRGIAGRFGGSAWALVRSEPGTPVGREAGHTCVRLERDGIAVGELELAAVPRPEARAVLAALRERRFTLGVLTGDAEPAAQALARALDVPVEARLSPLDKVARLRACGGRAAFVGDGLNDAPALAAAGVGISMAEGAAATLEAADVNLLRDGLGELPELFDTARRALGAARLNLAWAVVYNAAGMALAASGRLTPVFSAAAMVLSSAAVVWNTRRLAAPAGAARAVQSRAERLAEPAHGTAEGTARAELA